MQATRQSDLPQLLRVISEPNRFKFLCILMQSQRLCVSDLADRCGLSVAAVSHHLRILEGMGILNSQRYGKEICYSLSKNSFTNDLKRLLCKYNPELKVI